MATLVNPWVGSIDSLLYSSEMYKRCCSIGGPAGPNRIPYRDESDAADRES